jgi:hypothetical protein
MTKLAVEIEGAKAAFTVSPEKIDETFDGVNVSKVTERLSRSLVVYNDLSKVFETSHFRRRVRSGRTSLCRRIIWMP